MAEDILNVQFLDQRVRKLQSELAERLRVEVNISQEDHKQKSAAFVFLVAKVALALDDDEALDGIVEGGDDFGVDAIYVGPPNDGEFTVTLLQGKYKQNLEGVSNFPENSVIKMVDAIRIMFNPSAAFTANSRATTRIEEIRSLIGEGNLPQIKVILCNNGPEWTATAQQRIDAAGFGDYVNWIHAGPNYLSALIRAKKSVETKLQLSGKAFVEDHPYMRALVGKLSVVELANLFNSFGDVLLERNVRRFLGLSSRVNEGISGTLRDQDQRPKFYFYNNGITMICNKLSYNPLAEKDWIVQLGGLQIVNGGQTSKTVQ